MSVLEEAIEKSVKRAATAVKTAARKQRATLKTDRVMCEQFPDLLQNGNEAAIVFEYPLNRALGCSNACVEAEKAKAGPGVIDVRRVEGKPMVTGPDNVAQMPLAIDKGAD